MKEKKKKKSILIRLSPSTLEKVDQYADLKLKTRSLVIEETLLNFLDGETPPLGTGLEKT